MGLETAKVTFSKVATASKYNVALKMAAPESKAGIVQTAVILDTASAEHTFASLSPGQYNVAITAVNANEDMSEAVTSATVTVGAPVVPVVIAVTGGVGSLTVKWTKAEINAALGVTYSVTIVDVTQNRLEKNHPADFVATLDGAQPQQTFGGHVGSGATPLLAGTKRVTITATNANGAVASVQSEPVLVLFSDAPAIGSVVGSAAGATLTVTAPARTSSSAISEFLVQVGAKDTESHRLEGAAYWATME